VTALEKMSLEIHLMCLGTFKFTTFVRHGAIPLLYFPQNAVHFIIFCSGNTFLINRVLNLGRIKVKIWTFIFYTPLICLSDYKSEGFASFTYLRSVYNSENRM
jgi:hypothetical protein